MMADVCPVCRRSPYVPGEQGGRAVCPVCSPARTEAGETRPPSHASDEFATLPPPPPSEEPTLAPPAADDTCRPGDSFATVPPGEEADPFDTLAPNGRVPLPVAAAPREGIPGYEI